MSVSSKQNEIKFSFYFSFISHPDHLPEPFLVLCKKRTHELHLRLSSTTAFFFALHEEVHFEAGKLSSFCSVTEGSLQTQSLFQVNLFVCSRTHIRSLICCAEHSHASAKKSTDSQGLAMTLLSSTTSASLHQSPRPFKQRSVET